MCHNLFSITGSAVLEAPCCNVLSSDWESKSCGQCVCYILSKAVFAESVFWVQWSPQNCQEGCSWRYYMDWVDPSYTYICMKGLLTYICIYIYTHTYICVYVKIEYCVFSCYQNGTLYSTISLRSPSDACKQKSCLLSGSVKAAHFSSSQTN